MDGAFDNSLDESLSKISVKKRDGRVVPYNGKKIENAIRAASQAAKTNLSDLAILTIRFDVETAIVRECIADKPYDIERIQDNVEKALIRGNYSETAKAYILYRDNRTRARSTNSVVNKTITDLVMVDSKDLDAKRENANINGDSTMGAMLKIGGTITKEYNLNNLIKPEYAKLHRDGVIHIHDLDFYALTMNCLQIPLGQLLKHGFATGHGYLRTPASIRSAATLACIAIQSNQNDMFGGQAIPTLDYDLAPYVAKSYVRNAAKYLEAHCDYDSDAFKTKLIEPADRYIEKHDTILDEKGMWFLNDLIDGIRFTVHGVDCAASLSSLHKYARRETENDTFQAMEAMVHNLCTLNSRSGGQVPFSSVNFGTCTTEEGRMVSKNLLLAVDRGLGNGETAIFPISIFKMKKGINDRGSINYDLYQLACKVSAKRLFPNFENVDAPYNLKYYKPGHPETEIATMGAIAEGKITLYTNYGEVYNGDISGAGKWLLDHDYATTKEYKVFDEDTKYIELKPAVFISDSIKGCNTKVKKFMIFDTNKETKWTRINYAVNKYDVTGTLVGHVAYGDLLVTDDHPLPVFTGKMEEMHKKTFTRTLTKDLKKGNLIPTNAMSSYEFPGKPAKYIMLEVMHVSVLEKDIPEHGYDFETESDRFDVGVIVSHNCRTRTIGNVYDPEHQQVTGRGNLFFTTLNLPYLALEAKSATADIPDAMYDKFMELVDKRVDDIIDLSLDRVKFISNRKAKNYPFLMGQHLYIGSEKLLNEDKITEILKQGSMTLGFIGLAETLKVLTGKHHGESSDSQELGLEIIRHLSDRMKDAARKYKLNFALMGSPAEGCTGRLLRLTRAKFGVIKGVTDHDYLTNSFHIPVYFPITAWDKIQLEAPYHQYCDGGCISYIELTEDATKNLRGFEALVTAMADANMNYFAINHPVDRDPVCGYVGYFPDNTCPRCGRKEGEGVPVSKLLSLKSYSPDPEYAVRFSDLEQDEIVSNQITNPA